MPADPNRQRVSIRYQADDGNFYAVVTSRNHAVAINATGALAADPPLPVKWKTRKVNGLRIEAGRDKTVQLAFPNKTAPLWVGGASTFDLQPAGTYNVTGRTGERRTQGAVPFDGNPTPPNEFCTIDYLSDNGSHYDYLTIKSHAAAVGATGGTGAPLFPKQWTPRHYNCIFPDLAGRDGKLVLVEGNPATATWLSNAAYSFAMPAGNYASTGRKDENRPNGAPSFVP